MPDYGDNSPRENYGAIDPFAPSVANGQISPAEWARYQARRRRDAIVGTLLTLGGTTGLGFAGQALGGAGAGVSATSGSLPPVTGGAPWAVTPYAGTATMAPTGAAAVGGTVGAGAAGAGAAGAAGAAGGSLAAEGARTFMGLTPRDWLALAGTGLSTYGAITQDQSNLNPNTATDDPQLRRLLDSMQRRLDKSEPLYDSVMAMANGLLPTQYQRGGGGGPF